jgi:hypothetical protein
MDAKQAQVDSAAAATSTSTGAQIEEFRRRLAQQRLQRSERMAILDAKTKADHPAVADRPLLIAGTRVK